MLDWGKFFHRKKKHQVGTPAPTPPPASPAPTIQGVPKLSPDPSSSLPSAPPPRTTSTNNLSTTVGNGLIVALKLLKEAVTGIDVPGLEAVANGVVGVIDLIKVVKDNASDLGDLDHRISSLANAIGMAPNLHLGIEEMPGLLRSRTDMFLLELHDMMTDVQKMFGEKNPVVRAANSQAHKEAIEDIKSRINFLLNQFTAQGTLSLELNMAGARQDIRLLAQAQEALALAREYEDLIRAIPRADARYNDTSTQPSRPCHPGTRTTLLETILRWIDSDLDATPYFWLCGEVGVGKTTVAHTIAKGQKSSKRLGASFFFSRHDDSRRTPQLLFTSIAYQLARFDQGFYKALAETLKPDPDIVKRSPMEQFNDLVLQPLIQSGISPLRTVVIVIDGLDECSDPASVLDVLTLGIGHVGVRLRVLISSRPYAEILSKFKDPRLLHLTNETQFRDINPQTLSNDVAVYLSWSLGVIASKSNLPSPWPPKRQLDELIRRAAGLFIIASTYTKYIEDPAAGNPTDQLARILSRRRRIGSSPLAELDALYDQVLDDLKLRLPSDVVAARDIITILILGKGDIDIQILGGLLSVDPSDVRLVLRHLTAVIPLPEDDYGKIVPFHASFGEYVQDSTRCTVQELLVDAKTAYGRIVARCCDAISYAANEGIIGVEYGCAGGNPWTPAHWQHIADHLASYLDIAYSPQARMEALRATFSGNGLWTWVNIGFWWSEIAQRLVDAAGSLEQLPHMEGLSTTERKGSIRRLMIANHASEIHRILMTTAAGHESIAPEASELNHQQALKLLRTDALGIVRDVRCWIRHSHRNLMAFRAIDVKFDDMNVEQEVLISVASPVHRYSSLEGHLENNRNLDIASRIRMLWGVADGLRHLHGASPPQPHNAIHPRRIMVSEEGQPILYPSTWALNVQSGPPLTGEGGAHEITCEQDTLYPNGGNYGWNLISDTQLEPHWTYSAEARLDVDVWDFGSILYHMIKGEEPAAVYYRLTSRSWKAGISKVHEYEAAIPLLLEGLEVPEDVKELLKSCWSIRRQDLPPMSEVFERLTAIVQDMET